MPLILRLGAAGKERILFTFNPHTAQLINASRTYPMAIKINTARLRIHMDVYASAGTNSMRTRCVMWAQMRAQRGALGP